MAQRDVTLLGVTDAVVVGDDGSPASALAVRWASDEAHTRKAELVVLRAWAIASAPRPEGWQPGYVPSEDEYAAAVVARLRDDLDQVLGASRLGGLRLTTRAVHDTPEHALVEASREAALVVVGSHGRHGARALLGSTSEHLVRHAFGPVVVVPSR